MTQPTNCRTQNDATSHMLSITLVSLVRLFAESVAWGVCGGGNSLHTTMVILEWWLKTATADSDVVLSGRLIFEDFFQHLWPYIGNNTANVVFQMVKRLWLIRIDQ
ncbi:hypothetical protein TNCV_4499341 [Trichonephila clavipes]|nr:hypothetical protein TNCV_4499341 [Trichonephila clavipes]